VRSFPRLLAATFVLLLPALVVVLAACEDGATPRECTDIPQGGCPLARGVSCQDLTCQAVYLCRPNNVWELHEYCPARDGEAPREASVPEEAAPPPPSFDASIDAPPGAYGGPGCQPLQSPECSLGLGLSCGAGCCGCEDLYICENGGWSLWGVCGDGGVQQF